MRDVLVVQHCQSEHHVNGMTGGWTDTPLTDHGRKQAEALADRVARMVNGQPVHIYASDLQRAWQTAEAVGLAVGLQPEAAPALREHNGGVVTGKTRQWADANIDMENWSLWDWHGFEGGETTREFFHRVAEWLERFWVEHPGSVLPILVGHGGSVSHVVVWWLGLSLDALPDRHPFAGRPGAINVLTVNRFGKRVVRLLNDWQHLCQAGLEPDVQVHGQ